MDLTQLKLQSLGLEPSLYGRVLAAVDFGNVNYWYRKDQVGPDAAPLKSGQRLVVDIAKLAEFCKSFASESYFYYGWHARMPKSQHLVVKADRLGFVKVTKVIQYVRQHLQPDEVASAGSLAKPDGDGGFYVELPKCNFDVEITLDAVRKMNLYDTLCLFSGDSDFARLAQFLRKRGKRVIVIAAGRVHHSLREAANLYVNAQQIKSAIAVVR
ncbi:MAG TPA: NYN domain-containing protein [Candidatus Paceibacterota bacterium]